MSKFQNKYRTDSLRASWWDYTKSGCYFVTICTYGRKCFFGEVENESMKLSPTGVLAEKFWCVIPVHFLHVKLGAYVVMPNHVHGILNFETYVETLHRNVSVTESIRPNNAYAAMQLRRSRNGKRQHAMGKTSPAPGSLGTVIRSYKSIVTKQANLRDLPHGWQPKYFDRIIRSDRELQQISAYINNNPATWEEDELYGGE